MKNFLFTLLLMAILSDTFAQGNETILLYPEGTPGLKAGVQIPEDSKTTDGITRVKDVTQPALYFFKVGVMEFWQSTMKATILPSGLMSVE
jgi:hypothetical protein